MISSRTLPGPRIKAGNQGKMAAVAVRCWKGACGGRRGYRVGREAARARRRQMGDSSAWGETKVT